MGLKAKLQSLDGLDEAIKSLYRQEDDVFILNVDPVDGFALEDVSGLKSALGRQKTEIGDLKSKVEKFGDLDPKVAKDAIARVAEFANLDPKRMAEEQVRAALEQQQNQFNTQLQTKEKEVSDLMTQLQTVMIDQAATSALASKGGNIKLLLPHVKGMAKVVKGQNGFTVQVVDSAGHPRITASKNGTSDMTLEQLVEEMSGSDDFAAAFTAQGRPGSGSESGNLGNGGSRPKVVSAYDQNAVNSSIEDIAAGKAVVNLDTATN